MQGRTWRALAPVLVEESPETTTASPPTTAAGEDDAGPVDVATEPFPESEVTVALDESYGEGAVDEASFGIGPGDVTAAWYISENSWAVHFSGVDAPTKLLGKCAGAAASTATGVIQESFSPYGALACSGFSGTIRPPGSLFLCADSELVFVSTIPPVAGTDDELIAILAVAIDDAAATGVTDQVLADPSGAPEIYVQNCQIVS